MNLTLSDNRSLRLTTLCVLYVSQGMPDGFVRTGLKTYSIANGVTLARTSQLNCTRELALGRQVGLGPVIDRFSYSSLGRRRPWISRRQFFMGMTLASMLFIPNLPTISGFLGRSCFGQLLFILARRRGRRAGDRPVAGKRARDHQRLHVRLILYGKFLWAGPSLDESCSKMEFGRPSPAKFSSCSSSPCFHVVPRATRRPLLVPRRYASAASAAEETIRFGHTFVLLKQAFSRRASVLAGLLAACALVGDERPFGLLARLLQRELNWTSEPSS